MAYKLAVLEILRNLFVLAYILRVRAISTYRVYRLYDIYIDIYIIYIYVYIYTDVETAKYLSVNKVNCTLIQRFLKVRATHQFSDFALKPIKILNWNIDMVLPAMN